MHSSDLDEHILGSLGQTLFSINEDKRLSVRWGKLEKQQTYDPTCITPINEDSWVLDLDAFINKNQNFNKEEIVTQSKDLASYIYQFFRWSVEDDFLKAYGCVND